MIGRFAAIALAAACAVLPVANAAQAISVHAAINVTATVTAACTTQVATGLVTEHGVHVRCTQETAYTVMTANDTTPRLSIAKADAGVETMLVAY